MPLNKEQAEAAAKAIMDAELRKQEERQLQKERQQARAAGKKRIGICAMVGYFLGSALAAPFGGDSILWGMGGLVIGCAVGWRLGPAKNAANKQDF